MGVGIVSLELLTRLEMSWAPRAFVEEGVAVVGSILAAPSSGLSVKHGTFAASDANASLTNVAAHRSHYGLPLTKGASPMLKVTCSRDVEDRSVLRLEGKLLAPWIEVVRQAITNGDPAPNALRLDLGSLLFADGPGSRFLAELIAGGAVVVSCSGYLAALLDVEKS
jgi:hypothetical protein